MKKDSLNKKRKLTTEQQSRILSIGKSLQESIDLQIEPMKKAIESVKHSFPSIRAIESLAEQAQRINEIFIPDIKLFNEVVKKSGEWEKQRENMEFITQKTPVFLPPCHQKPMHPEDRKFLAGFLGDKTKSDASQEQSVFCWNTMKLKFPEGAITLSPIEKNLCSFLFKNPEQKVFKYEQVEVAVYGGNNSASKALDQAIKRLNSKLRKNGCSNLFRLEGENVIVLI
ncbi:helix-turn-helix domain-containing protein [bacterium]|jgi:hypothetical protein|nr:helix-turn-helix domain-containing protein [bacterium]